MLVQKLTRIRLSNETIKQEYVFDASKPAATIAATDDIKRTTDVLIEFMTYVCYKVKVDSRSVKKLNEACAAE